MFQVIVRQGRKIVEKKTFASEDLAWEFFDKNSSKFACEFRNLDTLKAL